MTNDHPHQDPTPPGGAERRLTLALDFPHRLDRSRPLCVHVVIEDVSEADAAAPVLYETAIREPAPGPNGTLAPFTIDLPEIGGREPAIRIHVDLDATDNITKGDFINVVRVGLPNQKEARCNVRLVEIT